MPNGLISHQAPGLLLKIKYPRKFDGTALYISAFVPDISVVVDYFFPFGSWNFTHSLLGLFTYTIPLTIILTIIFSMYIGPFVAKIGKKNGKIYLPLKFFGFDELDNLKKKKINRKFLYVASYSALFGGLSHILLDVFAHGRNSIFFPIIMQSPDILLRVIVDFGPFYIGPLRIDRTLTVFGLIWIIEDTITLIISLYLLRYIKKHDLISKWYNN